MRNELLNSNDSSVILELITQHYGTGCTQSKRKLIFTKKACTGNGI